MNGKLLCHEINPIKGYSMLSISCSACLLKRKEKKDPKRQTPSSSNVFSPKSLRTSCPLNSNIRVLGVSDESPAANESLKKLS